MNKKRIAVIGLKGLPASGGAASVGEHLIMELKNEYDFTVFSSSPYTNSGTGNYNGIKQIVFEGKSKSGFNTFIYYLKTLFHCLCADNYDLIHLHHAESGFIAPFLKLKYKVITTFHGVFANKVDPKFNRWANRFFRFSERMNIIFANRVISVSNSDKIYCEKRYNRVIEYIPNGVNNIELPKTVMPKKYDFIFVAARIYEIKGLHLLLKAIKEYDIAGKLVVIGDLNQKDTYKEYIFDLAKGMDIEFVPLITDRNRLFEYMSKSRLFVFPSLFEAMSMTLLEVVSLKAPVLASDIEANRNIFDDDHITYFRSNDYKDLAIRLSYCINNIQEISRKAENAYRKVIENYTWPKIGMLYSGLYESILR